MSTASESATATVTAGGHTAPAPTAGHTWQETPPVLLPTSGALSVAIAVGGLEPAPVVASEDATPVLRHEVLRSVPRLSSGGAQIQSRAPHRPGLGARSAFEHAEDGDLFKADSARALAP